MSKVTRSSLEDDLGRIAQEVAKVGSWYVDALEEKPYWSDITYDIHEVERGEPIDLERALSFYIGDQRELIESLVGECMKNFTPYDEELKIVTASGKEKWVRTKGRAVVEGNRLLRIEGVFQDIDDRKRAQIAREEHHFLLKESEKNYKILHSRMQLAVDASKIAIWDWDVNHTELVWDERMFSQYGRSKGGSNSAFSAWLKGIHPDDRKHCHMTMQDAISHNKPINAEFRVILPDGQIRFIRTKATNILSDGGKVIRIIGANWDVTKEKQDRDRLAKLNKELSEFAYRTSHDLKAPLVSITGLLDAVREELELKNVSEAEKMLEMIRNRIVRLLDLIRDMLDLTKSEYESSPPESFHLLGEIEGIRYSLADEQQVKWTISIPSDLEFTTIGSRLRQVLQNLISNAVKYRDINKKQCLINISAKVQRNSLHVTIQDNGLGIDERFHSQVFTMFSRFHPSVSSGSGLGLSLAKKHIDALGGEISFDSSPKGSTFCFRIPEMKSHE